MKYIMITATLLSSKIVFASCRYGECEGDIGTGYGSPSSPIILAIVFLIAAMWLIFSESSPFYEYFDDRKSLAWLFMWLSPAIGAFLGLLFK